jgi:hypothetical protein
MSSPRSYPIQLNGDLSRPPSRALWLVKWILWIPHIVVLLFLWVAFIGATIIAFFAILFTRKYPRGLFDFNLGVLRWSWRVGFYGYETLGTDRYPPFTLDEVPDYPCSIEVPYPETLSRGLVLIKWWLLAIPHYIVLSVFDSLITVLLLIAALGILFTGKYIPDLFKLVLGVNRWTYRVMVYTALMTDEYPPFRFWD